MDPRRPREQSSFHRSEPSFLSKRRPPRFGAGGGRASAAGALPAYIWMPAVGLTGALAYGYYAFLEEVPFTKRKRWIATSPEWERRMGDQEYQQLLHQFRGQVLPPNHRASITVQRVGSRIAAASKTFAQENPTANLAPTPYTYTVVRSDSANAFVLPNNHVFVLTGLFQYVRDEDDLAAVLGHEMAHNLARHAGEKISGNVVTQLVARLFFLVDPSGVLSSILLPAATILSDLPNSREAESEADRIGMDLAAKACYDPRAAKRVFAAMKEASMKKPGNGSGQLAQPPEFLSTHPSHDRRLNNMDEWMPEALRIYNADNGERCRHVRRDMAAARQFAAQNASQRTGGFANGRSDDRNYHPYSSSGDDRWQ